MSHEGLTFGNFSPRIFSNILRHLSSRINFFFFFHFENKNIFFIKMENEKKFLCFKLKVKGNVFAEKLISSAGESKEDFIELIRQSEEWQVEPTHSTLLEMARRKKIRNHTILTKYELKKALGLASENKPRSRSYVFSSKAPGAHFEFATRKDAMDGMNCSSTKLARGIKNGKILINNVEYIFERK